MFKAELYTESKCFAHSPDVDAAKIMGQAYANFFNENVTIMVINSEHNWTSSVIKLSPKPRG